MNRAWLYGHRRVLILLAAGALAVVSIATAVAGQAASPDTTAPAFNTEGDVDEPEDADSDDDTVKEEDIDEPEDADSDEGTVEDDDSDEPEDADSDDGTVEDDDSDEPEDSDSDDGDEGEAEEDDN